MILVMLQQIIKNRLSHVQIKPGMAGNGVAISIVPFIYFLSDHFFLDTGKVLLWARGSMESKKIYFFVHFVLTQNEPKSQEVFKELFASKTAVKSTLHASFRLHRNAFPRDLQLVLGKLQ